jgi:hypothetical protein
MTHSDLSRNGEPSSRDEPNAPDGLTGSTSLEQSPDGGLTTAQIAQAGDPVPGQDPASVPTERPGEQSHEELVELTGREAASPGQFAASIGQPAMPTQQPGGQSTADGEHLPGTPLLAPAELDDIVTRWRDIQADFVDEPRRAVKNADALVADLMQRLARMFAAEREELESRWMAGDDVSTEELRQGLRRYRSFFERLLAA